MSDITSLQKHRMLQAGLSEMEIGTGIDSHPEPKEIVKNELRELQIVNHESKDLLTNCVIDLCDSVQFPYTTAYMHGLGVISCAMNKGFSVELFGSEMPVTLYVVTSQPPSTGKSSINSYFTKPFRIAMSEYNDKNAPVRNALFEKLRELNKCIKDASSDEERLALCEDYAQIESEASDIPHYKAILTNATPESMEKIAFNQKGIFNVISDEAGAINSVLGLSYGESGRPSNCDMVLQGWDGNYFSSARITRDCNEGIVRGGFSVIAQDETINAIFKQGQRGNGVSERFLLCMEQNLLGSRNMMKYQPLDGNLQRRYTKLINNIVNADDITLKLCEGGVIFLNKKAQELEPHLADLGKYSDSMLRGFIGKMAKHVVKIACVLHAVENYEDSVNTVTISKTTLSKAFNIFTELTQLYIYAANETGVSGENAQLEALRTSMQRSISKGQYIIKVSQLLDNVKKQACWSRQQKITSHFRGSLMPRMAKMYWCDYDPIKGINYIRINPKL